MRFNSNPSRCPRYALFFHGPAQQPSPRQFNIRSFIRRRACTPVSDFGFSCATDRGARSRIYRARLAASFSASARPYLDFLCGFEAGRTASNAFVSHSSAPSHAQTVAPIVCGASQLQGSTCRVLQSHASFPCITRIICPDRHINRLPNLRILRPVITCSTIYPRTAPFHRRSGFPLATPQPICAPDPS